MAYTMSENQEPTDRGSCPDMSPDDPSATGSVFSFEFELQAGDDCFRRVRSTKAMDTRVDQLSLYVDGERVLEGQSDTASGGVPRSAAAIPRIMPDHVTAPPRECHLTPGCRT
jgi:hypothetical protein